MMKAKCPELKDVAPGMKCLYRAKIGGERVLIDVMIRSAPYLRDYGQNRKSWYADAFGYGWKGSVPVKKLLDKRKFFIQRAVKPLPSGRGYKAHLLAAGQAVTACGAGKAQAPALKQEPAYGAAR